jgi:acetyl esterase/lipase
MKSKSVRALLALLTMAICGCIHAAPAASVASVASDSADAMAAPGTLLRAVPMAGAPQGASASRILYTSVGERGEPIVVSGIVVVPEGPVPARSRPMVAWAHPTTGIVPACAPSLSLQVFRRIAGLPEMLARGWVVVATDYPGLGTAAPHPYLVGGSEARSVLDALRAARALPDAHAGSRFTVWGHSQGGQAALFTGLMAKSYAPELRLEGVAAAAPATDLLALLGDDFDSVGGRNLSAMTLWSWSRVYGLPIDKLVLPQAMPAVDALAHECIESAFDVVRRMITGRSLGHAFLSVSDFSKLEPWRSMLALNSPGPLPRGVPLFIAQGDADGLVRPDVTRAYAERQCAAGGAVRLLMLPGVSHGFAGRDGAAPAMAWIADRFAGIPAPSDCAGGLQQGA